jgi:hypothetical protein
MRQVIGENETQRTLDICVRVPRQKPAIEQIVDVFIKKLRITDVRLIPNKVIVCGDFEIKALYVACLPDRPVHAVEMRRVRFTADVPVWGACWGMDAEARVVLEFVDYDCPHHRGKYNYFENEECDEGCDGPTWDHHHGHHHGHDEECDDHHGHHDGHGDKCDDHNGHGHYPWCRPNCAPCYAPGEHGFREFNVSVVLCIVAKVMADREVVIYPGQYPGLPPKPKG